MKKRGARTEGTEGTEVFGVRRLRQGLDLTSECGARRLARGGGQGQNVFRTNPKNLRVLRANSLRLNPRGMLAANEEQPSLPWPRQRRCGRQDENTAGRLCYFSLGFGPPRWRESLPVHERQAGVILLRPIGSLSRRPAPLTLTFAQTLRFCGTPTLTRPVTSVQKFGSVPSPFHVSTQMLISSVASS